MRIRILGGGIYGCHLALALLADGHEVEIHEIAARLFNGASGNSPARGHRGFHYPRSRATRVACQEHTRLFEERYGHLTHGVPINCYAIADRESLVDFGTYTQILRDEVEFITVERPEELGLQNVEGAILTGERHFVVDRARDWFTSQLNGRVLFNQPTGEVDDPRWDLTIDATFCANDQVGIDRFEACLTVLLEGPSDRSITIMDGPLPGLYVWDEARGLTSLTSAKYTPIKRCQTWREAKAVLNSMDLSAVLDQTELMLAQMAKFYPAVLDLYRAVDHMFAVRALPLSASDARLVDVVTVGERAVRVRAGKIDAIFCAERIIKEMIEFNRLHKKHAMVA